MSTKYVLASFTCFFQSLINTSGTKRVTIDETRFRNYYG